MSGMVKILLFCFLLSLSGLTTAEEFGGQQESDTEVDTVVSTGSQDLQQQKDQLLGLLAQVDERYGELAASLKSIQDEIGRSNGSLDKIRREISAYQGQIAKLNKDLSGQVKAAYAIGQQDKLKLMLNQRDPALSSRMMVYYEYVNKSRLEKLATIQQTVRYLDQLDKDRRTETEALGKSLGHKKSEQKILEETRKQRNVLIAQLNDDAASEQEQLRLVKDSENKLINLIRTLEHDAEVDTQNTEAEAVASEIPVNKDSFPSLTGDFAALKGKLPLPVRGKPTSMIGSGVSEDMRKGVLINAHEGAEIRSVTKGKVAYAGTLKGYGLLVIIEHDKDFMTLYAFNQSLYKHKGDSVEAGDVIAAVGQSGGRSKPGLYFEIRQKGKAVDPLMWCRN
ncbi:MAG: peptidoglycan DD-metalloendopeptidase family protein [Methyloglobulus sp.]